MKLFTIGYGGRRGEEFLALLSGAGVELVADVRIAPQRSSMGLYAKAKSADKGIQRLLGTAGINYVWLEELGNPARGEPGMATFRARFQEERDPRTSRLREFATGQRVCLLCAEKRPEECHRTIISDYLASRGWDVTHLV